MATKPNASDDTIINLVDVAEVRVENHKMMPPVKFKGTESDNQRAISFYSTSGKLAAAAREISVQGRITALATNVNLNHICELNNRTIFETYVGQLFDPKNWKVLSFHNQAGVRIIRSTVADRPQVLLPVGDHDANWAAVARREQDITFVQVRASIDLSIVTSTASSKYTIDTFIELPKGDKLILDGGGNYVTVHTFLGPDDIRLYTADAVQTEILMLTRQTKPASLTAATFGMTSASLDSSKKDELFREDLIESNFSWLEDELFKTCCPGVAYRPSSALNQVKQIYTDANGNKTCVPIQLYMTNVLIAMNCMGRKDYEVDVVNYAVDNMDPDVKAEMESAYSAHLQPRARDPVTQTRAIQDLLVAASKAERKVINTRTLISNQATALMVATVPGYTAVKKPMSEMSTPGMASVAEHTIGGNTRIPDFEWTNGDCVGCGSTTHRYMKPRSKDITCPNANRPGAKENAAKNFAKMRADRSSKQRDEVISKPKWARMGKGAKRHFAEAFLADAECAADFNAYVARIKEGKDDDDQKPAAKKAGNGNVTVLPTIAVLNGRIGGPPPLPVKLDGNLPHCGLKAGGKEADNLVTVLIALIDSGAGATIGWLQYWEAVVLINPSILVKIFTCKDGTYSPITMQGIVDDASGNNKTDLPVAFQIQTRYHCRDGSELHMLVGLGMDVSNNYRLLS